MKRFYALFMLVAAAVSAWAFNLGGLSYSIATSPQGDQPGTVTCTGFSSTNSDATSLSIPGSVTYGGQTYTVVDVGESAFAGNTTLTTIKVSEGVKNIKGNAFAQCTALNKVSLSKTVMNFDPTSVDGCSELKSIEADTENPYLVTYLGSGALYTFHYYMLVRVPEGVNFTGLPFHDKTTIIGAGAVKGCRGIYQVHVPYGVTSIGDGAFSGMTNIKDARIPSSVTSLGDKVFENCTNLNLVTINMPKAPAINKSTMFNKSGNPDLYVPRGMVDAYKNAGWKNFKSINKGDAVAINGEFNNVGLCITSSEPVTINDVKFGGRAMAVRGPNHDKVKDLVEFPKKGLALMGSKNLVAVTRIDNYAFSTSNKFQVIANGVDTVGYKAFAGQPITDIHLPNVSQINESAFDGCKSLTLVLWGPRLKRIEDYAFRNVPNRENLILPPGFEAMGSRVFQGAKSKIMLVPSSLLSCANDCFYNISSLDSLICNATIFHSTFDNLDFTGVPTSCHVFVPVGLLSQAKANPKWKRFTNIEEGAFDFAVDGFRTGYKKVTVLSHTPITDQHGRVYDGKAAYVYNSNVKNITNFEAKDVEEYWNFGIGQRFYMTEVGDSLCYGSKVTDFNFAKMRYLERIGKKAFMQSKLASVTLPAVDKIKFGEYAFYNITSLREITMPCTSYSWEGQFFGRNANEMNFYVMAGRIADLLKKLADMPFSNFSTCAEHLAPMFVPTNDTYMLGVAPHINFKSAGINAYYVTGYDSAKGLQTAKADDNKYRRGAYLLTDLTPGQTYKVPRYFYFDNTDDALYLKGNISTMGLNTRNKANAYHWNAEAKKFEKRNGNHYITSGSGYLEIENDASELYLDIMPAAGTPGDVNGDGAIDVSDVNLAINVMLGKDTQAQYPAADVNGDGTVDVSDINLIINLMLGN